MDRHLLTNAHASVKGQFVYKESGPVLECIFEALDLGFEHPHEIEKQEFSGPDLEAQLRDDNIEDVPLSALDDLGSFKVEAYWFNRRRLSGIDSIGDQEAVRNCKSAGRESCFFVMGFAYCLTVKMMMIGLRSIGEH